MKTKVTRESTSRNLGSSESTEESLKGRRGRRSSGRRRPVCELSEEQGEKKCGWVGLVAARAPYKP